jgi:uncharacterized membrane protein YtjA (UPF0391 family)
MLRKFTLRLLTALGTSTMSRKNDVETVHVRKQLIGLHGQPSKEHTKRTMSPVHGRRNKMDLLQWAIIALVVAVVAGLMGFSGAASGAASIARVLFTLFLIIAAFLFLFSLLGVSILV